VKRNRRAPRAAELPGATAASVETPAGWDLRLDVHQMRVIYNALSHERDTMSGLIMLIGGALMPPRRIEAPPPAGMAGNASAQMPDLPANSTTAGAPDLHVVPTDKPAKGTA
jgi:hypothetical protein